MLRPLNSIFGRLVLLTVSLLVLMQLTWLVTVDRERGKLDADHASRLVLLTMDTGGSAEDERVAAHIASTLGFRFVDAMVGEWDHPAGCPHQCANSNGPFESELRSRLPANSRVIFNPVDDLVWIRVTSQ